MTPVSAGLAISRTVHATPTLSVNAREVIIATGRRKPTVAY